MASLLKLWCTLTTLKIFAQYQAIFLSIFE